MNNNMSAAPIIFVAFLVIVTALGLLAAGIINGVEIGKNEMRREAIKHGCAEYNSLTGQWQWKEQGR